MAEVAHLLRMPAVAAGSDQAVLQDWSVAEREEFAVDAPLATVETDKAVVEVEAESGGVILRALVASGDVVAVGAPIAVVGDPGEEVADVDALLVELGVPDVGAPTGTPAPPREPVADGPTAEPRTGARGSRLFISPLARRLAHEAGLDPSDIVGTGPNGRIRKRDVEAARVASTSGAAERPPAPGTPAPATSDPASDTAPHTDVPHTRLRRAIAARVTESRRTVPSFSVRGTADAGALLALRAELNDGSPVKVSVNDLLVKAVAVAHRRHPEMNVVWREDAVRRFEHVDVAVAVAGERGLVTPVLRSVDTMSVTEVAAAMRSVVERADRGALTQDELDGGAVSVSNLGGLGVEEFSAIVNPPHAAILAVGAVRPEPMVRDGAVTVGQALHLVLSVDHRPVDGALAATWMRTFLSILERPVQILA